MAKGLWAGSHWLAVAIDATDHFVVAERETPFIERILAVYIFDQNEVAHLCEAEASHYLHGVHYSVILKEDTPDDIAEYIDEIYGVGGPDDTYMHAWRLQDPENVLDVSDRFADDDYGALDDTVEFLRCNRVW